MIKTRCPICNSDKDYTILYRQNFDKKDFNEDIFSARRMPDKIHYQIVRCKNDGLVRSAPIMDEEKLVDLYKRSKFTYEDEVNNLTDSYIAACKPILNLLSKKAKILEVGCGNGFVLSKLYKLGFKNVFGIEPGLEAVNKADPNIKNNIIIDVFKNNILPPQSFDFIFFFQTLDHIFQPDIFIKNCFNILKPGGYILAFNHDVDSLSSKILKEKSPIIDIEHICLFSKETMRNIFVNQGFEVIRVYNPFNKVSLKHLLWLFPLPKKAKLPLLKNNSRFLNNFLKLAISIRLGNLCLIAKKI